MWVASGKLQLGCAAGSCLCLMGCGSSEVPEYGAAIASQSSAGVTSTTAAGTSQGVTSATGFSTNGAGTTGVFTTSTGTTGSATTGAPFTSSVTSASVGGTTATSTTATSTTGAATLANFSFFVTSLAGLRMLSGSQQGFGGNLSYGGAIGIAGADLICQTLAEASMPGAGAKGWRAFLSTSTEDAIDRVGQGPWYDREGRLLADDISGLLEDRPDGDPSIAGDLPNEFGIPNSNPDGSESLDNHDTMTASDEEGQLVTGSQGGGQGGNAFSTCMDWTSAEPGQDPPSMGHSWTAQSGTNWIDVGRHGNGCEALVHLDQTGGSNACGGTGVGCGGGYGGFYCFALTP